jgi:integrase
LVPLRHLIFLALLLSSIERRQRKNGRACYVTRWREGGKNRSRVFDTRNDALAWDAETRRRRRLGPLGMFDEGKRSVTKLYEEWLATHGQDLAPKTVSIYTGAWRLHVEPFMGEMRLTEVTPLAMERWARKRIADGAGEASIEKAWLVLSSMFARAVVWGWVQQNPVRLAKKPKKKNAKREPVVLTPAQVEAVRSSMPTRDAAFVSTLAYAGCRPGEALALLWSDIGETHITVNKAMSMGQVKGTKTGKNRRVPMVAPLRQDLREWRMQSAHSKDDDPVFPNFRGEYWTDPDSKAWAGRFFRPALKSAGIEFPVRIYDLRHTAATLMLKSGLSIVETAKRLGHSPSMCLDTYQHVMEEFEGVTIDLEREITCARTKSREGRAGVG